MTSFSVRRVPSRSEIEPPSVEELGGGTLAAPNSPRRPGGMSRRANRMLREAKKKERMELQRRRSQDLIGDLLPQSAFVRAGAGGGAGRRTRSPSRSPHRGRSVSPHRQTPEPAPPPVEESTLLSVVASAPSPTPQQAFGDDERCSGSSNGTWVGSSSSGIWDGASAALRQRMSDRGSGGVARASSREGPPAPERRGGAPAAASGEPHTTSAPALRPRRLSGEGGSSDLVDDDDDDLETIVLPGSGPGDLPHSFSGMHVRDVDGRPRDPRVEVRRLSATERSTQSSGQLLLFRR